MKNLAKKSTKRNEKKKPEKSRENTDLRQSCLHQEPARIAETVDLGEERAKRRKNG